MYGRSILDFIDPADHDGSAQRARATTAPAAGIAVSRGCCTATVASIAVLIASNPLYDASGAYSGSLGMFTDITQRIAIETQYRVLARGSEVLSGSLDIETLLGRFADLLVEELAGRSDDRAARRPRRGTPPSRAGTERARAARRAAPPRRRARRPDAAARPRVRARDDASLLDELARACVRRDRERAALPARAPRRRDAAARHASRSAAASSTASASMPSTIPARPRRRSAATGTTRSRSRKTASSCRSATSPAAG